MKKWYSLVVILFSLFTLFTINVNSQVIQDNPNALVVLPNSYSGTAGTATFLGPLSNAARTYQLLINANQLTSMVGTYITSITFRIPVSSTADWPASDVTFSNYDIYLAQSVPPSQRSLNFDSNIVGTKTQVRTGSLLIPTDTYRFGGNPNPFGAPINFNTSYLYTGGNLLVEIRHNGFSGTSRSSDAIGTAISGYGTDFSACWQSTYTATTGVQGNFCVAQLNSSPVPVGISPNSSAPDDFKLHQNYPNPFNPTTRIDYEIPFESNVKLIVFDMLGKEVSELVNSNLQKAGYYSVQFNAANLTSGMYFYKLIVQGKNENNVITKKMMLVK